MKIYLYIKTHNVTGLKYFGKTIRSNPEKYKGSGKYWLRHLRKHGNDVRTEILGVYEDVDLCRIDALKFSVENNIVSSELWANLMEENGTDGVPPKTISVKDTSGKMFRVKEDDPRWLSGELVGIATGSNSNINGKLNNHIITKDSNGNIFRVKSDDPRWLSGELAGINKGNSCHQNTREAALKNKEKTIERNKSPERRLKVSLGLKDVPKSASHRENLRKANLGMKWYHDPHTKEKVAIFPNKGDKPPSGYVKGFPRKS